MITYSVITEFNISEVRQLFELSFACLLENNQVDFHPEDNQLLDEWFDIDEMFQYVKSEHAKYIEARDDDKLVGAVCMGNIHC